MQYKQQTGLEELSTKYFLGSLVYSGSFSFFPFFFVFCSFVFFAVRIIFTEKKLFYFIFYLRAVESISSERDPTRARFCWLGVFFTSWMLAVPASPLSSRRHHSAGLAPTGSRALLAVAPPPPVWPAPLPSLRPLFSICRKRLGGA